VYFSPYNLYSYKLEKDIKIFLKLLYEFGSISGETREGVMDNREMLCDGAT
jgi:hypothetical protein